jgi:hypothetical protein
MLYDYIVLKSKKNKVIYFMLLLMQSERSSNMVLSFVNNSCSCKSPPVVTTPSYHHYHHLEFDAVLQMSPQGFCHLLMDCPIGALAAAHLLHTRVFDKGRPPLQ